MQHRKIRHRWIIGFTFYWSWLVIALGSFTRLTDSGLSCPDWPGCYGKLYVGSVGSLLTHFRMWAEMSHRYVAGILSVAILLCLIVLLFNRKEVRPLQWFFAAILFLLLLYQPLLGMWTVTLKLHPSIVSQHLLSGLSLMVLVALQWMYFSDAFSKKIAIPQRYVKPLAAAGAFLVFLIYCQLFLGAWTSTNYAGLSCDSFPFCHMGHWSYQFKGAFNLFHPMGVNYSGGVISENAKRTIQVVHRAGAFVIGGYILVWLACVVSVVQRARLLFWSVLVLCFLLLQVALGISIVYFSRPLIVAVLHTLIAGGLLVSVVGLNYQLWCNKRKGRSC